MEEGYLVHDTEGDENLAENSLDESSDLILISKKNTNALVWKYFWFEANENDWPCLTETPKCWLKDSNTTNLHSHLKYKHLEEYSLVQHASEKGQKKKKPPD